MGDVTSKSALRSRREAAAITANLAQRNGSVLGCRGHATERGLPKRKSPDR